MSPVDTRLGRPEAIAIAKAFVARLEGTYERLVVAGSIRRRLALVGDIEIVAVPKVEREATGLFRDMPTDVDRLDGRMQALLDNDDVAQRLDVNGVARWGPSLKYLTFEGARIDLFTPCAERFGWILILRTGPAAFSRQLVLPQKDEHGRRLKTRDGRPGLLPPHVVPRGGWLTYRTSGERIETTEEAAVFELFKLPFRTAWERV